MHKSRLCSIVIDCKDGDIDAAARFWAGAFGKKIGEKDEGGKYVELVTGADEPIILIQQVEHESRVHLDIESDDMDAEVARLEALGAKRLAFVRGRWWVLEAPTGQRFCVVRRQREAFGPHVNEWP